MKLPRCHRWPTAASPGVPLVLRGPSLSRVVTRAYLAARHGSVVPGDGFLHPRPLASFKCLGNVSSCFPSRFLSSAATASSSDSTNTNGPGILQLPGVHTPEQLLHLAGDCLRDCRLLLEEEEKREPTGTGHEEELRRSVQALDAVSNALCKVADAAELIRSVHPSAEWQQAGAQVVQEVQQFMSVANFSDSIYKRLRELGPQNASDRSMDSASRETAATALTKEEQVVMRCMRESMEQQGIHLSAGDKEKHLMLLQREIEAATACIETQDEGRCLELSVQQLLAAGVPKGLLDMRIAELQQQQQQHQQNKQQGMFSVWGRRKENRPTSLILSADDEFTKAILRTSRDAELRRVLHTLVEGEEDSSSGAKFLRLLALRQELARGRGFPSWAAFAQREGVLRTPEAVSTFLERIELALKPGLERDLQRLKTVAERLPKAFGVKLPLEPWDIPFILEMHALQHKNSRAAAPRRLPLETVWRSATEMVESLTGFNIVPVRPARGETWHWSVLKFELRPSGRSCGGLPRGDLYADLWARKDKTRLLAQFTVRGSKQMDYPLKQGWNLGGPLTRACVAEDQEGHLRQIPCCALVSNFPSPPRLLNSIAEGSPEDALALLGECLVTEEESVHLLHELGHAVHALLSQTEMQHLAGTRGAVDFAEFPSHFFEFFAPRIFRPHAATVPTAEMPGEGEATNGFGMLQVAHQLNLALLDRAFFSYIPTPGLLGSSGEINADREAAELEKLHAFLDGFFNERQVLGLQLDEIAQVPLWRLVGRPPLRAFEHLVHYGGNYFCYLFCRCASSYVWSLAVGRNNVDLKSDARLLHLLERGSTDCSAAPLLKLVEGQEEPEMIQELSAHPERLPLEYFLKHAGAAPR